MTAFLGTTIMPSMQSSSSLNTARNVDGYFTERTLQEYLVLATVFETCEFNNLNILKFMLSKETTLVGLLSMAGRKPERNFPIELCG